MSMESEGRIYRSVSSPDVYGNISAAEVVDNPRKLRRVKSKAMRRSYSDSLPELMKSYESIQLNRASMELQNAIDTKSHISIMKAITFYWSLFPHFNAYDLQKHFANFKYKITLRALKRTGKVPASAVFRVPSVSKDESTEIKTNLVYTNEEEREKIMKFEITAKELIAKRESYINKEIYWSPIPVPYCLSVDLRDREEVEKDMIADFGSIEKHDECLRKSGILIYSFRINGVVYRFPLMDHDHVELFLKYIKDKSNSGDNLLKFLCDKNNDNYRNAFWFYQKK